MKIFYSNLFPPILLVFFCFICSSPLYSSPIKSLQGHDLRNNQPFLRKIGAKGKETVLIFLSSKCPCSHSHLKYLTELKEKFPEFDFIGVHSNQDEKENEAAEYFKSQNLNFPVLYDLKAALADQLGALKTPHVFVLNDKGETVFQGGITNSSQVERAKKFYLQEVLTNLKAGKNLESHEARTLGCYISRKI